MSKKRPVPAWDFGAAKGTGASVVTYDPNVDRSQGYGPASPPSPPPRLRVPPVKNVDRILAEQRVERAEVLALAYRLAAAEELKPVPHDIRVAVATFVRLVGGSRGLASRVLHGELDDQLGSLLP